MWSSEFNLHLTENEIYLVLEGMGDFVSILETWNLPTDSGRNEEN